MVYCSLSKWYTALYLDDILPLYLDGILPVI